MSEDEKTRRRLAVIELCPREPCRVAKICLAMERQCRLRPPLDELVKK